MNRREFIKYSLAGACGLALPSLPGRALAAPIDRVEFNPAVYSANQAQTIMVFLYGGASELGCNFTNYDDFKSFSETSYADYFGSGEVAATAHGFWEAAGGGLMEELLAPGDLRVFRTCFSQVRWDANNRSHGSCVAQNQRGSYNEDESGIFANLAHILYNNGIIDENTKMPFLTMDGESGFYARGNLGMIPILEPISINENLDNPFARSSERSYTDQMDVLAQARNRALNLSDKITDAFAKRAEMDDFIQEIRELPDPELGTNDNGEDLNYQNNSFAHRLRTAIKILNYNPDTRVISLATSGLGGWDDHNDADNYLRRMRDLFLALRSAMTHIKQLGRENTINIMVMGDFGRGVNLNSANGWDHGNLQNFLILGGDRYFAKPGIVGETVLDNVGSVNRLFLRPAPDSYWFEPLSVAATIYRIYGVDNPEILTDNNPAIAHLF